MRITISIVLLTFLAILFQNCSPVHDQGDSLLGSGNGSSGGEVDPVASLTAFETSLFPIVTQNCGSCHGASQQPLFAASDSQQSHDSLVNTGLVNLLDPANSRVVQKIKAGHSGIATQIATDMEVAILAWATALQNSGAGGGSGGGGLPAPPVLKATFSSIHALILTPKCLGCHAPGGERPQEDYSNYQTSINTGEIAPGNANGSAMFTECVDGKMPEGLPPLSLKELLAIEEWIDAGALNN